VFCNRIEVLKDNKKVDILANHHPELYKSWLSVFDLKEFEELERQCYLFCLDQAWSNHLQEIENIREGIYLHRYCGNTPLHEFVKAVDHLFQWIEALIVQQVIHTFKQASIDRVGILTIKKALKRPSATWTYLVNDNPFSQFGISMIASRNIGLAAGSGVLAAQYLPIIILLWMGRTIYQLFKKIKNIFIVRK